MTIINMSTEKKCTASKLRVLFYSVDFLRNSSPGDSSQIVLRDCSEEGSARLYRSLATKPGSNQKITVGRPPLGLARSPHAVYLINYLTF